MDKNKKIKEANLTLSVLMGYVPSNINKELVAIKYHFKKVNEEYVPIVNNMLRIEDEKDSINLVNEYAKKSGCEVLLNRTAIDCLDHFVDKVLNNEESPFWNAARNNGYSINESKKFLNEHISRFFTYNNDKGFNKISENYFNVLKFLQREFQASVETCGEMQ